MIEIIIQQQLASDFTFTGKILTLIKILLLGDDCDFFQNLCLRDFGGYINENYICFGFYRLH